MNESSKTGIFSSLSAVFSTICVAHCMIHPFMILLLPAVAGFFSHALEVGLILATVPVSLIGFLPTWLKHRNRRRLWIYLGSVVLILVGQFAFHVDHEAYSTALAGLTPLEIAQTYLKPFLTFLGALTMAWAMYTNNRHTHYCHNAEHEH